MKPVIYFKDENPKLLMNTAPPFGFLLKGETYEHILKFQKNATTPMNMYHKDCGVVGNSGTLRLKKYSSRIDAHDTVFRVNDFRLNSFSGKKTTYNLYASPTYSVLKGNYTVLSLCNLPWVYSCQNILHSKKYSNIHMINPRFYEHVHNISGRKKKIPLTGIVAIHIALELCETVSLYGFTKNVKTSACFKYWDCGRTSQWYMNRKGHRTFHDFHANTRHLTNLLKNNSKRLFLF